MSSAANTPPTVRWPAGTVGPQAVGRLRAIPLRVDEVAFEVRGQHHAAVLPPAARGHARQRRETPPASAGSQATEVGQKPVTPYRGRRAATIATASGPSRTSVPPTPWTCTSRKPGTITWPASDRTSAPAGSTSDRLDRDDAIAVDQERPTLTGCGRAGPDPPPASTIMPAGARGAPPRWPRRPDRAAKGRSAAARPARG